MSLEVLCDKCETSLWFSSDECINLKRKYLDTYHSSFIDVPCRHCGCLTRIDASLIRAGIDTTEDDGDHRTYNVGTSDYATKKIQPWDIWEEYELDPWRADIVKRILRNKEGEDPVLDLKKIKHICDKLIELEKKRG